MNTLLTAIVTWLSINFGLPAVHEHPGIELVPTMRVAALRYRGLVSDRQPHSRRMSLNLSRTECTLRGTNPMCPREDAPDQHPRHSA